MKNSSIIDRPRIDPTLLRAQLREFRRFVEAKGRAPFTSFAAHPYVELEEGYKLEVHRRARELLQCDTWKVADVGTGKILDAVIASIQIDGNNLLTWQPRWGDEARQHFQLLQARSSPGAEVCVRLETTLFELFRGEATDLSFGALVEQVGGTYPLLGYLCFLKDRSRYLPIRPTKFDLAFEQLGCDFKTSHRCSWANYTTYLDLLDQIKRLLSDDIDAEVTLLDAHSFAWILTSQMKEEPVAPEVTEFLTKPASEREAIRLSRIGQGRFRENLLRYWTSCAVTGFGQQELLRASHIKPWAESDSDERVSVFNGLLLHPALDACFDAGFISFDDDGHVLISTRLRSDEAAVLGVDASLRLRRIDEGHRPFLAYHRSTIFR